MNYKQSNWATLTHKHNATLKNEPKPWNLGPPHKTRETISCHKIFIHTNLIFNLARLIFRLFRCKSIFVKIGFSWAIKVYCASVKAAAVCHHLHIDVDVSTDARIITDINPWSFTGGRTCWSVFVRFCKVTTLFELTALGFLRICWAHLFHHKLWILYKVRYFIFLYRTFYLNWHNIILV